jgi:hypothetical protein
MGGETRFERRLDKWIARATTPKAAVVIPWGEQLGRMDERLERIEAALRERR